MLVGYARVSTQDQNPQLQLDVLKAAGCDKIFVEKASGAQRDRPELLAAIDYARVGDTLVVWKLAYLDPEIAAILREAVELPDRTELPVTAARAQMAETSRIWNTPLPEIAEVDDFTVPGPDGAVPVRLFRPSADADRPVVIYIHSGGLAMGSLETHHRLMRGLALASDSAVLGVIIAWRQKLPSPPRSTTAWR